MKGDSRMNSRESEAQVEFSERPAPRRPYVKPEFSCEQVFESTALGCTNGIGSA